MLRILFENDEFLVAIKPVGLLSQPGKEGNFPALLEKHLRSSGQLGAIYPVHRLDRDVGGVMVYAKVHSAAQKLSVAMENRETKKEYLAIVCGVPVPSCGEMTDYLWRDLKAHQVKTAEPSHAGAKFASLSYRVLQTVSVERYGLLSLCSIQLHTGRNHQIRVQFASRNLPLLGDDKYGEQADCTIALWSQSLSVLGKTYAAEPPLVFPWTVFSYLRNE